MSWAQALKDVAVRMIQEAERSSASKSPSALCMCGHLRATHCGCGTTCLGDAEDKTHRCECGGFAEKKEGP
jgi:hypothetical protein